MEDYNAWFLIGVLGYLATWLLIPWVLLKPKVHASAAVAWILTIVFVPYLGGLLCLLIGTTRWERRSERKQEAKEYVRRSTHQLSVLDGVLPEQLDRWRSIARLASNLTDADVLSGNHVQILPDTNESMRVMTELIERAERWVHVEFYIWKRDHAGAQLRDVLVSKARSGVQVRFLYDGIGSIKLSREFLRPLREAGAQAALFTPGVSFWHLLTMNLRNHRKLIVTDQQAAFTGGMNIGDEYVRPTRSYGPWRDTQLVLHGPAAWQMQRVFAEDWFYATQESLDSDQFYSQPVSVGDVRAQVIADGPDTRENAFYLMAIAALGNARTQVTMTTPYFVPPEGLAIALVAAARRGVHVRLLLAGRGSFVATLKAARSYYQPLLDAGVEIYEYERGMYHAKTLCVDGEWALLGTANWDFRSLVLNFEVGVALYNSRLTQELEQHFLDDTRSARRIDPQEWDKRSTVTVLHEQFWRLFAPLM